MADEPVVTGVKKKRKYGKRGTHKLVIEGKRYVGSDVSREGNFLILKTAKGSVFANMALSGVVEVEGEIRRVQVSVNGPQPSNGGPQFVGGISAFKAARDRQLEEAMNMPGFEPADG